MVIGVKIKDRKTSDYMTKGKGWNKKGKTWSCLRDAKLAVCPSCMYVNGKELTADFLIFEDNGSMKIIPVATYIIDYLIREAEHSYRKENILQSIENIKKYCKENNIELGETNE